MLPVSQRDVRTWRYFFVRWGIRFSRRWRFFEKAVNNNREKSTDVYAHRLLSAPPSSDASTQLPLSLPGHQLSGSYVPRRTLKDSGPKSASRTSSTDLREPRFSTASQFLSCRF
jgi:hypothetical protein